MRRNILSAGIKKAQLKFSRSLIIALITILITVVFISNLGAQIKQETEKKTCAFSVQASAKLGLFGDLFAESINCPTKRIIIKNDLTDEKQAEQAKKTIADAVAECWTQFGQGKLNLFSGTGVFCSVCSTIEFENPKTKELKGFTDYFYNTEIKKSYGKGKTYSEYVSSTATGKTFEGNKKIIVNKDLDIINTSQVYSVILYYPKGKNNIDTFFKEVSILAPGAAVGVGTVAAGSIIVMIGGAVSATGLGAPVGIPIMIVGASLEVIGASVTAISTYIGITKGQVIDWAAFVYLMPYEKQSLRQCTYLPASQLSET